VDFVAVDEGGGDIDMQNLVDAKLGGAEAQPQAHIGECFRGGWRGTFGIPGAANVDVAGDTHVGQIEDVPVTEATSLDRHDPAAVATRGVVRVAAQIIAADGRLVVCAYARGAVEADARIAAGLFIDEIVVRRGAAEEGAAHRRAVTLAARIQLRMHQVTLVHVGCVTCTESEDHFIAVTVKILMRVTKLHVVAEAKLDVFLAMRAVDVRSEEHTSELQSRENLVCRLLLE